VEEEEAGSSSVREHLFACYWQGRLIPRTTVIELPFIKQKPDLPPLHKRLRGRLFFSSRFKVNPQKAIFKEHLDMLLNDLRDRGMEHNPSLTLPSLHFHVYVLFVWRLAAFRIVAFRLHAASQPPRIIAYIE
jgi:hypothetical protein